MKNMKFTKQEIADYVTGWLGAHDETHDLPAVAAAVRNALAMVDDDQDGIEARKEHGAI
jgi:hypothetical protein